MVDALNDAMDQRDAGRISPASYVKMLKALLKTWPHFIDGHAHLGYALMEEGKPKLALAACLRGLDMGEAVIPEGFRGRIEWGFLSNRPLLRAVHGAILCSQRLGKHLDALGLMEELLAWNPDDNQGIRYLIGSAYLRAGHDDRAERMFVAEAPDYPPYHFEHALLRYRTGDYVSAATSLRRGFVSNGYIAEILTGNPDTQPLAIWHTSGFGDPEAAKDYVRDCSALWHRTPGGVPFVRWLLMHPAIMVERASVLACQEALLWDFDFGRRREILRREATAREQIDDTLSLQLVQCRTDRHGRKVEPWEYRG